MKEIFKRYFPFFLFIWLIVGFVKFCVPVRAADLLDQAIQSTEIEENEVLDDESTKESNQVIEYVLEFPESIATYEVNEDDYNFNEVSTYAINGDVYAGSYNSTIVTLWNGLLNNNVGKDYVAFRSGQYDYYIFFGEDFTCSGSRFSGLGRYYYLNTYYNGYGFSFGDDSFNIDASGAYLYTNISPDYPSLENDRGLIYEQIQTVLLLALLGILSLRWIFINR